MDQNQDQNRLSPFGTVLLSFVYFQQYPGKEVRIEADSLVRTMMVAGCPRQEVAEGVLNRMIEHGLLERHSDENGVSYSGTTLGIEKTPPAPDGPTPGMMKNS